MFLQDAPEGGFLSSQLPQGASAALNVPFALRGRAGDKVGPTLRHRQGIRLANASEPQLLYELALRADGECDNLIDLFLSDRR
jgi:hypothetical protein